MIRRYLHLWALGAVFCAGLASAATPQSQLEEFVQAAGAPGQPERGRILFSSKHGGQWSCSNCHTAVPTVVGQHASTGKAIAPLAPAANPERFTDSAKSQKWFRRNCRDVLGRECTAAEKADVLAWLISLKI